MTDKDLQILRGRILAIEGILKFLVGDLYAENESTKNRLAAAKRELLRDDTWFNFPGSGLSVPLRNLPEDLKSGYISTISNLMPLPEQDKQDLPQSSS